MNDDIDITGNIRVIEWLKVELVEALASLYRALLKGTRVSHDILVESFAEIIILTYILARRLGIDFAAVDSKVQNKLKLGIIEEDEIEKDYNDLSKLMNYIKERN